MRKLFLLMLVALLAQGCVGVFLAGAAIGGVTVYAAKGHKTQASDHNISLAAEKQIDKVPELTKDSRIIISTYNGSVLLTGQTPTQADHDQAVQIVRKTKGVKKVYDELTIAQPISMSTQSKDSWITTKAKSELLAAKGLDSSQIKVITENGVIYLMGVTTAKQAQIATNTVRQISGVKKVVTLFEYQS